MKGCLYSIGYQGYSDIQKFVGALKQFGVEVLIDVRSVPYSKYYKSWNKENLNNELMKQGIYYRNFKRAFGARQDDLKFYSNGRLDFELFSKSEQFVNGVERVEKSNAVICFMCSESLPSECHRSILVTRTFSEKGCDVLHILKSLKTVTQKDIEKKLVNTYFGNVGLSKLCVDEAYRLQNDKIGWKK